MDTSVSVKDTQKFKKDAGIGKQAVRESRNGLEGGNRSDINSSQTLIPFLDFMSL